VALRHAVLAALLEGEASGYELSKRFHVSVANFWTATAQQVYRELDRLEEEGLLRARRVRQSRRPDKRVFSLTASGRAELRSFTAVPAKPVAMRDDLLVKVHALDAGDGPAVRAALTARLAEAQAKLARYDQLCAGLLAGRSEDEYLREADRVGPYLTLLGGRMYEQLNVRWCRAALRALDQRSGATRR
jgi:DNA-binding PadR family transcriptional regulator